MSPLPLNSAVENTARSLFFQSKMSRFPLSFYVGRWIVIRMTRWSDGWVSSGSQWYLSRKAAWMVVSSGEEIAPVAGSYLVGCSGSLRNVLFASMAMFTRCSPLVLGLSVLSQAVSWALTSAQFTSCTLVSGWSSDTEIPVLCK